MEDAVPIVGMLIPIFSVLGLFTAIALNIYFKYKTNTVMSERVPIEALGEWYRSNAKSREQRARGNALRWGGFLTGLGLGVLLGCIIVGIWGRNFDNNAISVFIIFSLAMVCGGGGMLGAYFLERRLNEKSK